MIFNHKTCSNTWLFIFCITGSLTVVSSISAEPLNKDETSPAVKGDSSVKGKPVSAKTDSAIETIVVTGQKIERSLQDTKESVEVFTQKTIEERGMTNIGDVYEQTAGVSGDRFGFRIRGVNDGDTGTLRSELSSVYVDGVALSGWVKNEGPRQLWDVEQVEVLRGPQSTNLGRNALAGAVVIKTIDPEYDNTAALRVGFSEFGGREYKAMGNVNLIDGVSALRISVEDSQTDGHVHNITRSSTDYAYDENQSIRLKWLLEPADNLRMVLSYQHLNNQYGDSRVRFDVPGFNKEDRISRNNDFGVFALDADIGSLIIDYQINDDWSVKSITAGMKGDRLRKNDFDHTAAGVLEGGGYTQRNGDDKNFSQEFRFNYEGDTLRGSIGAYYNKTESYNENNNQIALDLESRINAALPGAGTLLVSTLGVYPAKFRLNTGGDNFIETKNYAFFTEWEWELSEHWLLNAGLRYNYEQQQISLQKLGSSPDLAGLPAPGAVPPALAPAVSFINSSLGALAVTDPEKSASTDFEAFLPHVGVTYAWDDETSLSFFVKQGYRAGGIEVTQFASRLNPFDSEYLLNYELAFRSIVLDGRGTFNANAYYNIWRDKQVSLPDPDAPLVNSTFRVVENAGKAKMQGIEMAFNYDLTDEVSVFAVAALSQTEFKKFKTAAGDFKGNKFALAPAKTGAMGINYKNSNGYFFNGNMTFQSRSYTREDNEISLSGRALANVRGGYESDRYKLELYVSNLFDKLYVTHAFGSVVSPNTAAEGRLGPPRMLGARATVYF